MERTVEESYAEHIPNDVWQEKEEQGAQQISEVEQVISSET